MNYLQLCQFVNRQLGDKTELLNSAPLDVTIPFGPLAELCASVNDAYQDIQ